MSLGCEPLAVFKGIFPWKKQIEIPMLQNINAIYITRHLSECSGADLHNGLTSASST